jgi:hypothetical protein
MAFRDTDLWERITPMVVVAIGFAEALSAPEVVWWTPASKLSHFREGAGAEPFVTVIMCHV